MYGKTMTLTFVLNGKMPSKKNNNQATCVRQDAYAYINEQTKDEESQYSAEDVRRIARQAVREVWAKVIQNKEYQEFILEQRPDLEKQAAYWSEKLMAKGLFFPITKAKVNIRFYFAQAHRQDTMNKAQTILDLLVLCRILKDDDYTVTDPQAEGQLYKDEIRENICEIKITIPQE